MTDPEDTDPQSLQDMGGNSDAIIHFEPPNSMLPEVNNSRIFKKAVQAIHCHPVSNVEVSALARRVINALYIHAQQTFAAMPQGQRDLIKEFRGTPIFRIQVGRLREIVEHLSSDYSRIYEALDNIFEWKFSFNIMEDVHGESQLTEEVLTRILIRTSKGYSARAGEVSYEIHHDVLMMILEPYPFAKIDMMAINALGSSHAIALYENLVRYLGTNSKVTARMPVETWVNLISGVGNYPNAYYNFKRFVLKPGLAWLEKIDAVPFRAEILEFRGPKAKVVELQFKLHLKKQGALGLELPPPSWSPKTVDVLTKVYSMSKSEIAELAIWATEVEIQEAMNRDAVMVPKKLAQGEVVRNRAKFLKGILRNLQSGKAKDSEPELEPEEILAQQVQAALDRIKKMKEAFGVFQLKRVLAGLQETSSQSLALLRTEFEERLKDNATISGLIEADGWNKGNKMLLSTLAKWILDQPDLARQFLTRPEDTDFDLWKELQQPQPN